MMKIHVTVMKTNATTNTPAIAMKARIVMKISIHIRIDECNPPLLVKQNPHHNPNVFQFQTSNQ